MVIISQTPTLSDEFCVFTRVDGEENERTSSMTPTVLASLAAGTSEGGAYDIFTA